MLNIRLIYKDTEMPKLTFTLIATAEHTLNTRYRYVGCLCTTTRKYI